MAELKRMSSMPGVQAALEEANAYKEMLAREAAEKAAVEARHAAEEAQAGAQIAALVEAATIVAAADGRFSESESQRLVDRVGELTDNAFTTDDIAAMANDAHCRIESEGVDARARAVAEALPDPELRSATLLVASAVAWLDGGVGQKEGLALQSLARAFGISTNELHKIMGKAHG